MKKQWNLFDSSFAHDNYAVAGVNSNYVSWNRDIRDFELPTFYSNTNFKDVLKQALPKELTYGLLIESKSIIPHHYKEAKSLINNFNLFFTHNSELLKFKNARWIPGGGIWIGGTHGKGVIKISEKERFVSMVSSTKKMCPLHKFRLKLQQELIKEFKIIDFFGDGVTGWVPVNETLEKYMFSIVVENFIDDLYFTEKINNCFATGTIPIYLGARKIDKIYNKEGIITFSSVRELKKILKGLSKISYYSKLEAIKENFEICKQFRSIEDFIYINYFDEFRN